MRRYKSEHGLSLGAELAALRLSGAPPELLPALHGAISDLLSITRARAVTFDATPNGDGLPAGRFEIVIEE